MNKAALRKLALGLGALLLLALVALSLFGGALLGRAVKYGAETFGPRYAKAPVTVGSVEISLFSGRGEVRDLVVGNPAGFSSAPAVTVGRVKIAVEVGSLLSNTVVVEEISVDAPRVNYELSLDGSNINRLLENLKASSAKPAGAGGTGTSKPGVAKRGKQVVVKRFAVSGGSVKLAATMLAGSELNVPLPAVELKDVGSGADASEVARQLAAAFGESILGAVKRGGLAEAAGSLLGGAGKGSSSGLVDGLKGLFDSGAKTKGK